MPIQFIASNHKMGPELIISAIINPKATVPEMFRSVVRTIIKMYGWDISPTNNLAVISIRANARNARQRDRIFEVLEQEGDQALIGKVREWDQSISDRNLNKFKCKILKNMKWQRLQHICKFKGTAWDHIKEDQIPTDTTTITDFVRKVSSEEPPLKLDNQKLIRMVITFLPDELTTVEQKFSWMDMHGTEITFHMQLLSKMDPNIEKRFGVSLQGVNDFVEAMTKKQSNGTSVRYDLKWSASDPQNNLKEESFLFQILHNQEVLKKIGAITYSKPIAAQWQSLFQLIKTDKMLHVWIEWTITSVFWRIATAVPNINSKCRASGENLT